MAEDQNILLQGLDALQGPTWVLYHYPCPDGIFAALAACLYHRAANREVRFVPNTVYNPKRVDDLPCTSDDAVYLLDFAGPHGFAEQLAGKAGWVGVLDHHKTALETLPPPGSGPRNLHTLLDMNRSGATVSWDYFAAKYRQDFLENPKQRSSETSASPNHPSFRGSAAPGLTDELASSLTTEPTPTLAAAQLSTAAESFREHSGQSPDVRSNPPIGVSESGPSANTSRNPTQMVHESGAFGLPPEKSASLRRLFEYIEDADLWRWALPDSKAFGSGLKDLDIEYDALANPGVFDQLLELRLDDIIRKGQASLAAKDAIIAAALETSFEIQLGGGSYGTCLAVVVDGDVARLRSELGNRLASKSAAAGHRAIGAIAYAEPGLEDPTLIKVSLRSEGEEDTTVISQAYHGGGHKNASSFIIDKGLFHDWQRSHITM